MRNEIIIPRLDLMKPIGERVLHLIVSSRQSTVSSPGIAELVQMAALVLTGIGLPRTSRSVCRADTAHFHSVHGARLYGALCTSSATGFRQF